MLLQRLFASCRKSIVITGLLCAGYLATPDARATVTCTGKTYWTFSVSQPWMREPFDLNQPKFSTLNAAIVHWGYRVAKSGNNLETVAITAKWGPSLGGHWYAAEQVMGLAGELGFAAGYGLMVVSLDGNEEVVVPDRHTPAREYPLRASTLSQDIAGNYLVIVVRTEDQTRRGAFGRFGAPLELESSVWSPANQRWDPLRGANCGGEIQVDFQRIGLLSDVHSPVSCTINDGHDVSYTLPEVAAATMEGIGALPVGYAKQERSISYKCINTTVTDPVFTMALVGAKAGTTNALKSNNDRVGVMVEARDNRTGTYKDMIPNPTPSNAEKIRIYDAGAAGGSALIIQAYPVRSAGGTIEAGTYTATGTLQIFTQ